MEPVPNPLARALPAGPDTTRRRRRHNAGFTVVEVTMATFVMLFAIATAVTVIQSGFRILDTTRKTTLSAQIMQSEMERIRMLSWGNMVDMVEATEEAEATGIPVDVDLNDIFPGTTPTELELLAYIKRTFDVTRHVSYLPDRDNEMVNIVVTITWRGLDNIVHTRTSSTQYTKDGLYAYYYRVPSAS